MTLILTATDQHFIAVSDVLGVKKGTHDDQIQGLPLLDKPSHIVANDHTIAGAWQKSIIHSPNHLTLMSGDRDNCRKVVSRLHDSIRLGDPEPLQDIIESLEIPPDDTIGFSIIHHWLDSEGLIWHAYHQAKSGNIDGQEVIFSGTGDFHFVDGIRFSPPRPSDHPGLASITPWLKRIGTAFFDEAWDRTNLNFLYGGWFEITLVEENEFRKIPYGIKFWRYENGKIFSLPLYLCWYYADHLICGRMGSPTDSADHSMNLKVIRDPLNRSSITDLSGLIEHFQQPRIVIHVGFSGTGDYVVLPSGTGEQTLLAERHGSTLRYRFGNQIPELMRSAFADGTNEHIFRPFE